MKFEIAVGSMLGASEYVAEAVKDQLCDLGHNASIHFEPAMDNIDLTATLIVVTSTHGAGDLPDNIQAFEQEISQKTLNKLSFIVIGLGDSSYDTFCQGAMTMESSLIKSGADLLYPAAHIDVLHHPIPEDEAVLYIEKVLNSL